jgi:phosphate transport system substrate-binding protein
LLLPTTGFATTLKIGGTGAALGTMRILADEFARKRPDISIVIPDSLGSGGGIKATLAGALDIALSSRQLKSKEQDAGAKSTKYATTPFVLVTPASLSNPDPSLTSDELIRAFSGEPVSWSDGTPIRIILRNKKDSSTRILVSAFEGMDAALAKARAIPGIPVADTEQDNMDLAETLPGALTTGSLTVIVAENRPLTPIAIDGVKPTLENLADGTYPIYKSLYLVTGPKMSQDALDFFQFVQSSEGAAILRKTGNLAISSEG